MFIFVLEQLWSQSVFTTPRFVSKAGGRIEGGFFFFFSENCRGQGPKRIEMVRIENVRNENRRLAIWKCPIRLPANACQGNREVPKVILVLEVKHTNKFLKLNSGENIDNELTICPVLVRRFSGVYHGIHNRHEINVCVF